MLKSLLLFGISVALCAAASAQLTFRWEQGNTHAYNSYRYKSIGFQNVVVQVADAPPLRYGVRKFAAFRIIVLNEDTKQRVELVRIGFPVTEAEEGGFQRRLSGRSSSRAANCSRKTLFFHGGTATKGSCCSMEPVEPGTRAL